MALLKAQRVAPLGFTAILTGCALSPHLHQEENLAQIYTQKATLYLQEGKLAIALEDLKKALAYDPDNAEAHGLLAILYEQVGLAEKAEEHYRRAVDLDPENLRWRSNYGRFLCFHDRPEEGLEHLQRVVSFPLYENRHVALTNAALCAMKLGREALAESYLDQVLGFLPNYLPAIEAKALLEIRRGNIVEAQRLVERYRHLGAPEGAVQKLEQQLYRAVRGRSGASRPTEGQTR